MGSFMLVWFEGNVAKAFAEVAAGQDEFTVWHRAQLADVTGLDLNERGRPASGAAARLERLRSRP